jgi:hypothetical protein
MTSDSASDKDTFLLSVRQCRPDIHVDVPVPGDLVFVSSCLVSLIFGLVEKKTVVTKCAITLNEYPETLGSSMRKIHASVIFVS